MPADKIIDDLYSGEFKGVFFLPDCRKNFLNGESFSKSWKNSINSNITKTYLPKDCVEKLKSFSDMFGSSDKQSELGNCDLYISYFEGRQKELHEKAKDAPRIYSTLGILAGVLAVIVLF